MNRPFPFYAPIRSVISFVQYAIMAFVTRPQRSCHNCCEAAAQVFRSPSSLRIHRSALLPGRNSVKRNALTVGALTGKDGLRLATCLNTGLAASSGRHGREQARRLNCTAKADEKDGALESDARSSATIKQDSSDFLPPGWPTVGLALFGLGFLLGPPLDGIHSRVGLQIYDNGAINLFGLQTNIWVPPMLGVFYSLAGLLQLVLDKKLAPKDNIPTASLTKVVLSFMSLAVLLELSAVMYQNGVPFNIEGYVLFFLAELNWVLLENTWWGFGLAVFIGVVCPLAEIPILNFFGLWHYPKADVSLFGGAFISWVICCYFFYTPFISNLARWLNNYYKDALMK